jgi:hypothetical protein
VEWRQLRDLVLINHPASLPRSMVVRAVNHATNEVQRKVKEDTKKRYEK